MTVCAHVLVADWGDIPTWVQAVTTTLALIAAGLAWLEARAANNREAKRDRQRDEDAARDAQARWVAAWPVWRGRPTIAHRAGATVVNRSELPVYDVAVTFVRGNGAVAEERLPLLPPGEQFVRLDDEVAGSIGLGLRPGPAAQTDPPEGLQIQLRFRDSSEREWTRSVAGSLLPGLHTVHPLDGEGFTGVTGAGLPPEARS